MRTGFYKWGVMFIGAFIVSLLLLSFVLGCGGGEEQAAVVDIDEMWNRAGEADKNINSEHMEISIYYENTQFGGGQTMSMIVDRNGKDTHEKRLLFGQVVSEYILVGNKGYYKEMDGGTWTESPVNLAEDPVNEYTSKFLELPSMADSCEYLGTDAIDGRPAERFRFILSPASINDMFPSVPPSDFSQNSGGEVNAWIDGELYYLVRYELSINDVLITNEIGNGDIRFVVNITKINEPIEIAPPI